MNEKTLIVDTDKEIRIDQYLSSIEELELTRAKIQKMISSGFILVNDKKIKNIVFP